MMAVRTCSLDSMQPRCGAEHPPACQLAGGCPLRGLLTRQTGLRLLVRSVEALNRCKRATFQGHKWGSATRVVQKARLNGCCRFTDLFVADPIQETSILQRSRSN